MPVFAGLSIPRRFLESTTLSHYSNLMRSAFVISAASLVLGSLLLLADLDNFAALTYLFFTPPFNYISVGAWLVAIDVGLCFILLLVWRAGAVSHNIIVFRALHAICIPMGLAVALYTGLFLASMRAVPLWNTLWLPALFMESSISCGIVVFLALIQANGKAATFPAYVKLLAKADIIVVALELLCAAALVLTLLLAPSNGHTTAAGVASVMNLIAGKNAWIWWGGFVGLGLLVTATLEILTIKIKGNLPGRLWSTLGVSFCVLAGALALRYCIVVAGAHPALGF